MRECVVHGGVREEVCGAWRSEGVCGAWRSEGGSV